MWDINRDDKRTVEAKCPQCGQSMANMGLDFASPKKDNVKEWAHIKNLHSVAITFHSCGCTGPGYIPNSAEKLREYLENIKQEYQDNLTLCRKRIEPTTKPEIDRENSKPGAAIRGIPYKLRPKKGVITNEEVMNYWFDRIKEIEQKIDTVK